MKNFNKIIFFVILFSSLKVFALAYVYEDPALYVVSVGNTVTVTFKISNVNNLHSWTVRLRWDPTKVRFMNASEGDFLNSTYSTFFNWQPATMFVNDSVTITDAILGTYSVSGSGTLFTATFTGLANGTTYLNMSSIWLYDQYLNQISFTNNSGFIVVGGVTANLKIFLQGPYNTGTGLMNTTLNSLGYLPANQPYNQAPWNYSGTESVSSTFFASNPNIVDWVLLEFRSSPTTVVSQCAALLKNDGTIVDYRSGNSNVVMSNISSGNYYVVVRYLNHLAVMTSSAITINSTSPLYNFTTGLSQFYGGQAAQISIGVYGMYAGDVDGNGLINATDKNLTFNARGSLGYYNTDVDRNGLVNASDKNICFNNRGLLCQVP